MGESKLGKLKRWIRVGIVALIPAIAGLFALFGRKGQKKPKVTPEPQPEPANRPPVIIGEPLTTSGGGWRDVALFDAGDHVDCYGYLCRVFDPDGDLLEFLWDFVGPNEEFKTVHYSVFDPAGRNITGQYTKNKAVKVVIGWTRPDTPFPFSASVKCDKPPQPSPPTPPGKAAAMLCKLLVRDGHNEPVKKEWKTLIHVRTC